MGNYIYDPESGAEFALDMVNLPGDTTGDPLWWQDHVPLWITATNAGMLGSYVIRL